MTIHCDVARPHRHAASRRRGYSLIELLVVLAVLAVLATMALPMAEMSMQREKEADLKRALLEIRQAIDDYHQALLDGAFGPVPLPDGVAPYPPDLATLTRLLPDQRPAHRGELHRFLRRIPRDPFADAAIPAEQSWATRSYFSDADHPRPGADVYDVSSRSPKTGLNGIPLSQW